MVIWPLAKFLVKTIGDDMIDWLLKYVLSKVTVDRLIAYALNWLIKSYLSSDKSVAFCQSAKKTLDKSEKSILVAKKILADDKIEASEVTDGCTQILDIWAAGGENKDLEAKLGLTAKE